MASAFAPPPCTSIDLSSLNHLGFFPSLLCRLTFISLFPPHTNFRFLLSLQFSILSSSSSSFFFYSHTTNLIQSLSFFPSSLTFWARPLLRRNHHPNRRSNNRPSDFAYFVIRAKKSALTYRDFRLHRCIGSIDIGNAWAFGGLPDITRTIKTPSRAAAPTPRQLSKDQEREERDEGEAAEKGRERAKEVEEGEVDGGTRRWSKRRRHAEERPEDQKRRRRKLRPEERKRRERDKRQNSRIREIG